MNSKLIGLAVVALVVGAGVLGALVTGVATPPLDGADTSDSSGDYARTPHESTVVVQDSGSSSGGDAASSGSGGGSGGDAAQQLPPFSFTIKKLEKCGETCRDVTASITNNQNEAAESVTVRSVIYTDGDKIWEGQTDLGTITSGETATDTKRVKLGYLDAYKVQQNDGKILIKTYVITDDGTYVYKETRDVA